MRLFIAIDLPEPARQHLVDVQQRLRPHMERASFTKPDNLHLTLKFLGECDEKSRDGLVESLGHVKSSGAIELHAEHAVCFPPRGPVRIVAAELATAGGALVSLHAAIEQRCKFLGFEQERRRYVPHVTLARGRPTLHGSVREIIWEQTASVWPGPMFAVTEFLLVHSQLTPAGSMYRPIARFPVMG